MRPLPSYKAIMLPCHLTVNLPLAKAISDAYTPLFRATVDARNTMLTTVQRQAEDVRQQIRKQHSASIKKGNYKKHDPELDEVRLHHPAIPSCSAAD